MAFITTANALSIIYKTDIKSLNLTHKLYKKPIYFFSKYEKNSLLAVRELLADSEKFFTEYYKPIVKKDTLRMVYEGKPPAYHKTINCPRLRSDYENFLIPETIRERGKETVIEFRKWFKENKYLLPRPDVFVARLQLRWGVNTNPENITRENSGFWEFENYTPKEIEDKIDKIIKQAGRLYYKSTMHTEILKRFSKYSFLGTKQKPIYNNDTDYSDEEVKEVLKNYHIKIKKPLKPLLIEYYRITLNPDLNLKTNILDQLGFRACGHCHKSDEIINIQNNVSKGITDTYLETYNLICQGLSIEDIAFKRGLTAGTIIKHVQKLSVDKGITRLNSIKPNQSIINKVHNAILSTGDTESLRTIFEYLNEEISYDDIKLALIFNNL